MGDASGDGVLSALGTVHIWISLVLLPLAIVGIMLAIVIEATAQKNWKRGVATCQKRTDVCPLTDGSLPYQCSVPVSVDTMPGVRYQMTYRTRVLPVDQGQSWEVAYDPARPSETLTQDVKTPSSRVTTLVVLGVLLALMIAWFVVNLKLRNNKTFRNVSGVMEIGDLVQGALSR